MRKLLLLIALYCSLLGNAQLLATNEWFDLSWVGVADHHYVFRLNNKQPCATHLRYAVGTGKHEFIQVDAGRTIDIRVPYTVYQANLAIKVKTEVTCIGNAGNSAWLEIRTPDLVILPLREPVQHFRPSPEQNNIISLYDIFFRRVRTLREKDLYNSLKLLPAGTYFVRGSKTITKICNKCLN